MKTDNLNNEIIRRYIPNVLTDVEGETPLAEKLRPFIDSAKMQLEKEFLSSENFLSEKHNDFALKILVVKAFADALPSLDLVVTPTGLGIVSTDNLAPASKERVDRLVSSLCDYVRANLILLVDICRTYEEWRQTACGKYFCYTFARLSDCDEFRDTVVGPFDALRSRCMAVEAELAERYLGRSLISEIHSGLNTGFLKEGSRLFDLIHSAVITLARMKENRPDDLAWKLCRTIVNELEYYPGYYSIWLSEMGHLFSSSGFENNIKGSFYF